MQSELITNTGSETWNFLKTDYRNLFMSLLKVQLVALLILILTLVVCGVVVAVLGFSLTAGFGASTIAIGIFVIGVFLIGLFFSGVANSVGYNVVDGAFRRTRVSFEQMFGMNTLPMLKYIVLILLIEIAVFAPIFVIAFIIMGAASLSSSAMSPVTENVVELFIRIVSTIVGGILYLFTQFVLFELLIARKGIIDSFRGSFGIMMRKPLETIVFSFALWAAETAVGLPFIIALIALVFVGVMFGFSTAALGALAMLPLIIIGILIAAVIFIVMIVIQTAVLLSAQYVYWNKVKAG